MDCWGSMTRAAHFASYLIAALILAGAGVCGWAYLESLRPGVSGEILIVIGGVSFLMLWAGAVLAACIWAAHREMSKWECLLLGVIAILGVGLLPTLGLSGF